SNGTVAARDISSVSSWCLDLTVANQDSDNISILLGNVDGTFQTAVDYAAGDGPYYVAIGDLDGDSTPDLAVANRWSDNISILLGNGDGTFQAAVDFGAGSRPESVALGDLNNDGILDLAVANNTSDNISILLGNADGTFQARINYAAGSGPISIALGDLDSDGELDLAVANRYSDTVSIFINTTPPPTTPIDSDRSSGGSCFVTAGAHGNAMPEWFAVLQQFCRTVWGGLSGR
ncbi:MAG: VCBS repeat-containing protein, partial [Desulfobacterales bacterium]|nr:VCBS repeat-containing protein [Desulfobacterales bacterium]